MSKRTRAVLTLWILVVAGFCFSGCNAPIPNARTPTIPPKIEEPERPADDLTPPSADKAQGEDTATPTVEEPVEPSDTPEPTEAEALVTASMNANCRRGPSTGASQYAFLLLGESAIAQGWNEDAAAPWFVIPVADKPDPCWISGATLEYSFDPAILPFIMPPPGSIAGEVWHEICEHTGGEGGEPLVLGQGCAEGVSPPAIQGNGVHDGFEDGFAGVTLHLGAGACPSTGITTTTTDANGQYSFTGLSAGTYCVSFDPLSDGNDSVLIPGGLTYPSLGGTPQITVDLLTSQNLTGVVFGWMWQFGN
jgi:hypothetical protein